MRKRVLVPLALCALVAVALARPGGGGSFSGGGGHSSGGGSGSSGGGEAIFELIYWILRLIIEVPQLGLPLLAIAIGYWIYSAIQKARNKDWDSGPPVELQQSVPLGSIARVDENFSQIAFEDFMFRLFATAQRARSSDDRLATVAPYVSAGARTSLRKRAHADEPVLTVIVGSMRAYRVDLPSSSGEPFVVGLEFEANVTTAAHTYYSVENWLIQRGGSVKSKPPGTTKTFPCPNCGAPWEAANTGTQVCSSCGQTVDNGRFDWSVYAIQLISMDARPPTVTNDVPERGNDLPTYTDGSRDQRWAELRAADPDLTESTLFARNDMIYAQLNAAWAGNDLGPARGVVSDGLYDYLQYWIDVYKAQGLRNALDDMRITHQSIAKIVRDKWFDAITIRVWGTGKDYVVDTAGHVKRGSKRSERAYTEYWTLIRSAGKTGAPKAAAACPNCGAPLEQINEAGTCDHCGAHVTAGEFDWVLSKIEQDDTYRG